MTPQEKKEELKRRFQSRPKKEKLLTVEDLNLDILPETFEWFRKASE